MDFIEREREAVNALGYTASLKRLEEGSEGIVLREAMFELDTQYMDGEKSGNMLTDVYVSRHDEGAARMMCWDIAERMQGVVLQSNDGSFAQDGGMTVRAWPEEPDMYDGFYIYRARLSAPIRRR